MSGDCSEQSWYISTATINRWNLSERLLSSDLALFAVIPHLGLACKLLEPLLLCSHRLPENLNLPPLGANVF